MLFRYPEMTHFSLFVLFVVGQQQPLLSLQLKPQQFVSQVSDLGLRLSQELIESLPRPLNFFGMTLLKINDSII